MNYRSKTNNSIELSTGLLYFALEAELIKKAQEISERF